MSRPRADDECADAGFSLVEVLAALVIAAMALVVLMRGLGSSQLSAIYLESQLGARLLAQSLIEDERQAADTRPDRRSGTTGQYSWQLVIQPTQIAGLGQMEKGFRFYRLSAEVTWQPRGRLILDTLKVGK